VFMPFPGWELMLLLDRSRPNEKRVLTTMTPPWGIARRPRSLMRTTTSPSHPAPRYAWCRADSTWQTLPQARTVTPHHWSSQTSRLNDGIASHTRQQTQSSQTRWQAESKNIRRSWKTRLMQESTTGTEPPYQSQRSRDGSTIWEVSDRIQLISPANIPPTQINQPQRPQPFIYPDCRLMFLPTKNLFFQNNSRNILDPLSVTHFM
jgi:hypothetical protein